MDTTTTTTTVDLFPRDHVGRCRLQADCLRATVQQPSTRRWFITFGHANFNSPANNGRGYATEAAALAAIRRLTRGR